jgi:predicted lactoylglutathione lyase
VYTQQIILKDVAFLCCQFLKHTQLKFKTMSKKIFINLPVTDLTRSMDFYSSIGFTNNPQFTDATAACMVLTDEIYVMLLTHKKLAEFTGKAIINAKESLGVINCISVDSAAEVNSITDAAVKAGGAEPTPAKDYGFMQQRSFEDPDGNDWEVIYMDMSKFPGQ